MNHLTSPNVNFRVVLMRLLTSPWLRVGIALTYTAILTVYLLQPNTSPVIARPGIPGQPDLSREIIRTFGHFVTFGGLTLAWTAALSAIWSFRRALAITGISMVMFSAGSEWAQNYVYERTASVEDFTADVLGVLIGAAVVVGVRWMLTTRRQSNIETLG